MGVWPRGAQVRRTPGWSMKPLSSRKTMLLPALLAFFYMGPPIGPPLFYRLLVSLPRPALRFLAAPSLPAPDLPDMAGGRLGSERIRAPGLSLGLPTADGCGRAADLPGHLPHPEAIFDELDGPAAPGFQCGGGPLWPPSQTG